ncbi:MAG: GNAT family N-acetyltransferase [Bacteroidia bacterium]|nr:GNAT family N-acetyltransferase [Bacteroidia bacterium]MCF8425894.1 GNAT family N-acetyltransferase [Bacteroidia bacterium]
MEITRLNWDSDFFGYEVSSALNFTGTGEEIQELQGDKSRLIYAFSNQKLNGLPSNFFLADEKIILGSNLTENNTILPDAAIVELKENTPELMGLALQSGEFSRFKVDPNFVNHEFENLYAKWIENSFLPEKNTRVFAYQEGNKILGFISIAKKENKSEISLIAVSSQARGLGIGSKLIEKAFFEAASNGETEITVVTQGQNLQAMSFYLKNKFSVLSKNYIYHIWK